MKRLLALLAAFVLPVCALAEPYAVSIQVDAAGEAFLQLAESFIQMEDGDTTQDTVLEAELLQKLIHSLRLEIVEDDNSASVDLFHGEQRLIDYVCYANASDILITSTMCPGYTLKAEAMAGGIAADQIDWTGTLMSAFAAAVEWFATIEPVVSHGLFAGDAYDVGTKCTTWKINDADIVDLVNAMLTEDVRTAVKALAESAEYDGEALLAQIAQKGEQVAQENLYSYLLRMVQDEEDRVVGASLSIMKTDKQLATISAGTNAEGVKIVMGLGLPQENYWGELTINCALMNDEFQIAGMAQEWNAPKDEAYSYVSHAKEPVASGNYSFAAKTNEAGYEWQAAISSQDQAVFECSGNYVSADDSFASVICMGSMDTPVMQVLLSGKPAAEIPAMDPTNTVCTIDQPEDAELYEKLMSRIAASLMARLIKVLPMELVMKMNQFTMP